MSKPTPHGDKLTAALVNPKSNGDLAVLEEARTAYRAWITGMEALTSKGKDRVLEMVRLLNAYKDMLEVELIMKRGSAFLKRQKGQLKLDCSVIEEFCVHLVRPEIMPAIEGLEVVTGPQKAFLSLSFHPRSLKALVERPEVVIKSKDQDFVVGSHVHYRFSSDPQFGPGKVEEGAFVLAAVAAECKLNLDKTMFQEAVATSRDLKIAVPSSLYFLVCEFLDMTPVSITSTQIDDVLVVRKAKRMSSNVRQEYRSAEARRKHRKAYVEFLESAKYYADVFQRMIDKIQSMVEETDPETDKVLKQGHF